MKRRLPMAWRAWASGAVMNNEALQDAVTAARERQAEAAAVVGEWETKVQDAQAEAQRIEAQSGELVLAGGHLADAGATIAAARSTAAAAERGLRAARRDAELARIELQEALSAQVAAEAQRIQELHDRQYSELQQAIDDVRARHGGDLLVGVKLVANPAAAAGERSQAESMRLGAVNRRQMLDRKFPV
jgi:chromosome segregation ATPase